MTVNLRGKLVSLMGIAVFVGVMMPAARAADEAGFVALFDGSTLDGWDGDRGIWRVEKGMIVGESTTPLDHNDFLATQKTYGDFELVLEFRLHGGRGNSGIQFRTERLPDSTEVRGYQADIGEQYWGCLYDEERRKKVLAQAPDALADVLKMDGWNTYRICARGDHVLLEVNGLRTVDYHEPDASLPERGILALQVHSGAPTRVDFRNIRIRELRANP